MKPAEARVLEGLRKTTLAYLSDKEYAEVVEAVEKQGILSLTGAASRLVKGAVVKHGSHDQKTHGRRGGGGGGGGGGSKKPKRINPFTNEPTDDPRGVNPYTGLTFQQEITNDISEISNKARDLTNGLENNPVNDPVRDLARRKTYTMRDSLDKAFAATTPEGAKEGLQNARRQIKPIVELLEDQNYNAEAAALGELGINITSTLTKINRGF